MFIIADEDMPVVEAAVGVVLNAVADGAKRFDKEVDIGDGICPIVVSGYWVVDTVRIDIRIKK
ncbi:unnamed protein product [marine sediment metagenome]|uniref:Uncharacterized protein n=1 Tax=marine sediment metagenome TaxID=412755 RepID=X1L0Q5_9ZZZZ